MSVPGPAPHDGAAPHDVDEDHHPVGPAAVAALNEALLAKAAAARLVKTGRVRADTTVVEANVAYPMDSGLLARGVAQTAKTIARIKAAGLASASAPSCCPAKADPRRPDGPSNNNEASNAS